MLGILVRQTCGTFADEEQMMDKYRIPRHHSNVHFSQHSVFIRKLYTTMLHIAQSAENFKTPIPSTYSQTLIQLYTGWLVDHVSKVDRELAALLIGKAPDSELERDVVLPPDLVVPISYSQFLASDNASLQDRNLFEKLKRMLRLKEYGKEEEKKKLLGVAKAKAKSLQHQQPRKDSGQMNPNMNMNMNMGMNMNQMNMFNAMNMPMNMNMNMNQNMNMNMFNAMNMNMNMAGGM
ncbi:MAG: hypothetical protein EZS28_043805 [Streblomastix strix]|uniref:Hemerythrin-like domain-containing protein n=1 Tax=Streblomastix strix TaxID=222440 RepID=A0A5J4TR15_9EUKA|nr:MAG: hypothetical protein EZS28_043805 [Streblomastix strix]